MKAKSIKVFTLIIAAALFTCLLSAVNADFAYAEQQWEKTYQAEDQQSDGLLVEKIENEGVTVTFFGKAYYLTPNQFCEFTVEVPFDGFYYVDFCLYGYFEGTVIFDGSPSATMYVVRETNGGYVIADKVFVSKGTHKVRFQCNNKGYCVIDSLTVKALKKFDFDDCYKVDYSLSNPNASAKAKELFAFIKSNYGKNIISGQNTATGFNDADFQRIKEKTGKLPAIMGLELMEYSPALEEYKADTSIGYAIEFAELGGIVTMQWHWIAPRIMLAKNDNGTVKELAAGFRTRAVIEGAFAKAMNDENSEEYKAIVSDLHAMAKQLQRLSTADVPVLFRPLHEASGGWFWWGTGGKDAYLKLWRMMYDMFTRDYQLNNLIWVWNGQNIDWYPGDDCVDIVGEDIYPNPKDYSARQAKFAEAVGYADAPKVAALTECGVLSDIDEAIKSKSMWSWFLTWTWVHTIPKNENEQYATDANGNFITDGDGNRYPIQTELYMWKKVYNHPNVITLGDLPFHTHSDENADKICDVCNFSLTSKPTDITEPISPNPQQPQETDITWIIVLAVMAAAVGIAVVAAVIVYKKS